MSDYDPNLILAIAIKERERQRYKAYSKHSLSKLRKLADTDDYAEKLLCEKSFVDFFQRAWKTFDSTPYIHNWHIDAICQHLQATIDGDIRKLIVNIPPRCAKSSIVSFAFPAWVWIRDPGRKFLTASHSYSTTIRDNKRVRLIIESEFYQKHWGDKFHLSTSQAKLLENDRFGHKDTTTVSAMTTGKGGDILIIDDPSDSGAILSQVKRDAVIDWYRGTMSTRVNNPKTAIQILIMQRLDELDLSGFLLKHGGWEHLCIKMEYEGDEDVTSLGWSDPREEMGELLWPERYGPEEIAQAKEMLNPYGYSGQMQQSPVPRTGGYIKFEELKYYTELPKVKMYSWSWDLAVKTGQHNDYSVGMLWAECEDGFYLVDCFRKKVEYPALRQHMKSLYDAKRSSEVIIEEKSSGEPLVQELRRSTSMPIIPVVPNRDMPGKKEERVTMISPLFEAGKIYLPENQPWVAEVVEEWTRFPRAAHDDTVDAMSQYLCRKQRRKKSTMGIAIIN